MPQSAPGDITAPFEAQVGFAMGRLQVDLVQGPAHLDAVQRLRAAQFRGGQGSDLDRFDPHCQHLLIRDLYDGTPCAAARLRLLADPASIAASYTAQFYDLGTLASTRLRMLEIGRICIAWQRRGDPDILRALLAGLTQRAMAQRVQMLVGCASFAGASVARHAGALRHLAANHIGPEPLRPRRRDACATVDLARVASTDPPGPRGIPPLLRMYLGMGGWVSDHAVRDPDLDTLHVFTAVETGRIPPARRRVLQALARGPLLSQHERLS